MSGQEEVIYECNSNDDFEQIPSDHNSTDDEPVSYIKQLENGRYIQHFFQVTPKSEDESLVDRYNRLRSELILLHDRIQQEQLRQGNCNWKRVEKIQTFLSALNAAEHPNSEFVDVSTQRLARLEKRISKLEWTLRTDSSLKQNPTTSVLKSLEDLKVRVTLLTPDLVQKIHRRIKENTQTNSARSDVSAESSFPRDEKQSGITEMHELVKRWDERCKEIPNIVDHLTASQPLQLDANRVVRKYAKLIDLKTDIEKILNFQRESDLLHAKRNQSRLNELKNRIQVSSSK